MSKVRVANFTVSLDGYGSGADQRLDAPFGDRAGELHEWMELAMAERERGLTNPAVEQLDRFKDGVGATIMGRNMFGPQRGEWEDESWRGWWGANPPYEHATFVHTHHVRPDLVMEGGTTFHFTSEPIEVVLERAREAADGKDVVIAGGASTVRQYLRAGLIDEIDMFIAPIIVGTGERFFDEALREFTVESTVDVPKATLIKLRR
ncbi:dihydrofolate reductase [Kribbella antibiotica]|uniref:Dihydrofolate reductase n=1 Tax=Kribbella antibiotica TaxID=190195 RepID=A0A4R4ZVD4_9ACTN|nr:dihydrofolate reductase family protein [Kribbella antibiotica]TDD61989.1 dihydrofolate reductase [Kribbella antibiotica]